MSLKTKKQKKTNQTPSDHLKKGEIKMTTKEINPFPLTHPQLIKEWHPTKNEWLRLNQFTKGSSKKAWWQCEKGHEWQAVIADRTRKQTRCPYCSHRKVLEGFNDLTTCFPSIAKEWHPTKNDPLLPNQVIAGSNKKVWWQCVHGHEWEAHISFRTVKKTNCPYCVGQQIAIGFNDLATTDPVLASEWHPTKNLPLTPQQVTKGSQKNVWWQCKKGHEWQTRVGNRANGTGCPFCQNHSSIRRKSKASKKQKND